MALIEQLWPKLQKAAEWILQYGDADGDGLIDYERGAESGLANQGWKDSHDSVFHADGRFPKGPIALVEVQGYAFAAYRAMAGFCRARGDEAGCEQKTERTHTNTENVEARFWMEDQGFYGIA